MSLPREQAASWLASRRNELAERVTAVHFERKPELMQRYGAAGRDKCLQDSASHLSYLEQAVGSGQAVLFENYIVWARILLENLGIPPQDLRDALYVLTDVLVAEAPADLSEPVLAPLVDVLNRFDTLPTEVQTFLDPTEPHSGLARRYMDHLLGARRREASQLILGAVDQEGVPIRDIYLHVFQPVQYEIGRLWQLNQVSVAQEHFCTAATQLVMSQLYPHLFGTDRNGFQLVTACVSGDLHEIGARILTDFFEMEGWDTFYIGANTPTSSILQTVNEEGADLVALSATMVSHMPLIEEAIRVLRNAHPDLPIMVGGYPFLQAPELVHKVGANATAVDAAEAVRVGLKLVTP